MSSDVVIRAEGLGKKYLIGHRSEARAASFREALGRSARGLARSAGAMLKGRQLIAGDEVEEFWALKDVSFNVKRGEVVGIIGRNGAGKSTLLKILSRITEPSQGRVEIRGRVASLLEVGTGFHPELTGRENIFLNGAILGMTRAEIRRKFDEIVDFAGIEKFLDTPVKRYSSGMYVRLAFAVAAHLEPEILIVDEVLAVGDAEFQKKCLGKMQDVAGHGRTVLFVSHNTAAIRNLCQRALLLAGGRKELDGSVNDVVPMYIGATQSSGPEYFADEGKAASRKPFLRWAEVRTSTATSVHEYGDKIEFHFEIGAMPANEYTAFSFQVMNAEGVPAAHFFPMKQPFFSAEKKRFCCIIPFCRLNVGQYSLTTHLTNQNGTQRYEELSTICTFEIVRTTDFSYWGWRPSVAMYFEEYEWHVVGASGQQMSERGNHARVDG